MDPLDQFVQPTLGCGACLRDGGDLAPVHDDKAVLAGWRGQMIEFLAARMRLQARRWLQGECNAWRADETGLLEKCRRQLR